MGAPLGDLLNPWAQFPHLHLKDRNNICFLGLLGELNDLTCTKCFKSYPAQGEPRVLLIN